jgi:hypothetical protein
MKIPVQFKRNLFKSLLTSFSITLFFFSMKGFKFYIYLIVFVIFLLLSIVTTNSVDLIFYMIEKRKELKNG